jgi:DUF4097 and DUF4098 domain-containing protein YvlB
MTSWEFPTQEPIDLHIHIPAGKIAVTAMKTGTANVTVDPSHRGHKGEDFLAATRVEFEPGRLSITAPENFGLHGGSSLAVSVELPAGSSCQIVTASADIRCRGELGSLDVRSASGDLAADRVTGQTRVNSASGAVRLDAVADVEVETASGNVQIGTAAGDISVVTASGSVAVGAVASGRTDVSSASGDISVAVAPGIGVYLDVSTLSGTASNELDASTDDGDVTVRLRCRTLSGNVRVGRAEPAAAR